MAALPWPRLADTAVLSNCLEALAQKVEDLEDEEEERDDAEGKARGELQVEVDSFCELAVCAQHIGLSPSYDRNDFVEEDDGGDGSDVENDEDAEDMDPIEAIRKDLQWLKIQMRDQIMDSNLNPWTPKDTLDAISAMTLTPSSKCGGGPPLLYWGARLVRAGDPLIDQYRSGETGALDLELATQITNLLHDINLRLLELHPEWTEDERHARSLAEIRSEQARTDLCIPQELFRTLVREIGQDFKNDLEYEDEAMDALQAAAEAHLIRLLQASGRLAIHAGRQEVQPGDLRLAHSLLEYS